jgi:hypothetical protein
MDLSVLGSIGSFMVSEHVLKPKASVLIILGCVLAYDLTTKTHDVSSLRIYRGNILFVLALVFDFDAILLLLRTPHPSNENLSMYTIYRPGSPGIWACHGSVFLANMATERSRLR